MVDMTVILPHSPYISLFKVIYIFVIYTFLQWQSYITNSEENII